MRINFHNSNPLTKIAKIKNALCIFSPAQYTSKILYMSTVLPLFQAQGTMFPLILKLGPVWPFCIPLFIYLFVYLGFYVAFNTVQVISRWVVGRAEETSTYSSLGFCTVNCRPTASKYQLSHLRPCRESNPGLSGGRRECYHSATMAPLYSSNIWFISARSIWCKRLKGSTTFTICQFEIKTCEDHLSDYMML